MQRNYCICNAILSYNIKYIEESMCCKSHYYWGNNTFLIILNSNKVPIWKFSHYILAWAKPVYWIYHRRQDNFCVLPPMLVLRIRTAVRRTKPFVFAIILPGLHCWDINLVITSGRLVSHWADNPQSLSLQSLTRATTGPLIVGFSCWLEIDFCSSVLPAEQGTHRIAQGLKRTQTNKQTLIWNSSYYRRKTVFTREEKN